MLREDMTKMRKVHGCCKSEGGFSLLELAVVMIIIGVLTVPILQGYKIYQEEKKKGDTLGAQLDVSTAASNYWGVQKHYPCPSDRSIPFGEAGHGVSNCALVMALGPNSCSPNDGVCKAVQGGLEVFIGGVPYSTMGIPYYETLDGWGRGLTYAVTGALADPAIPFDANDGAIQITNENGLLSDTLYHGVLVSHGPNGAGSFNMNGIQQPCVMTYAEAENCDNDGLFMNALISLGENNNYFDDLVNFSGWTQSAIWEYTTEEDVKSANTGNVGVGTTTPTAKLDVAGDLKAGNVRSDQICDENGQNCFPSRLIAGEEAVMRCPPGRVLVGIANNAAICENISISVTGNCPPGQFVVRITAGGVQCAAP